MPSESIEAEFTAPPAISPTQEELYRELEQEGPLSGTTTVANPSLQDLENSLTQQGFHVVGFDRGEDPRDWPKTKKWFVTFTTGFICLAVAVGSSIITGDLESPAEEFQVSQEIINLTVTCFVIGFGVGPLFWAPLSEAFGRTPMYIASMLFYFVFTLPSALARNAATLVVARQIAGLGASACMSNVGGSIADVWAVADRGPPMAIFSFTLFMGPCIGPLIAGFIGQRAGWRWIYWVLLIFSGLCLALSLFIPETLAPTILRKKAAKLRKSTGDDKYRTVEEMKHIPMLQNVTTALKRPISMLCTEPIVTFMTIYLSFIYSVLYLLFFAYPIAFFEIRGFSMGMTGVTFISIMIGIGIALYLVKYQEQMYIKVTLHGNFPEARLYGMMVGAIILPVALLMFAFTGAYVHVHWIAPCIAGALFGVAMLLIYISGNSYIVDSYSDYAASAIAAKTFLRSIIGAMVPLYVNQMFHNLHFQWAGLLVAIISVAILPIPFFFYRYGQGIRQRSARASKSIRRTAVEDVETVEK